MATVFYIVLWSPGIPSCRQPSPSTWSLKADIFIEALTNAAFYNPFIGDRTSLFTGLKLYIVSTIRDLEILSLPSYRMPFVLGLILLMRALLATMMCCPYYR